MEHVFQYTISGAAIRAAIPRISGLRSKGIVAEPDQRLSGIIAAKLDLALQASELVEILDTWRSDEVTFLSKLRFEGDVKLIGLLGHESCRRENYPYSGVCSRILISVCDFPEAARSFSSGQWKSMDGRPVFAQKPEAQAQEPVAAIRRFQRKAREAEEAEAASVVTIAPPTTSWTSHEVPSDVKSCASCGRFYPPSCFYLARARKDGVRVPRSICKECFKSQRNRTRGKGKGSVLFEPVVLPDATLWETPPLRPYLPLRTSLASWKDKPDLQTSLKVAFEHEEVALKNLQAALQARTDAGNTVTRLLSELLTQSGAS